MAPFKKKSKQPDQKDATRTEAKPKKKVASSSKLNKQISELRSSIQPRVKSVRSSLKIIKKSPLAIAGLVMVVFVLSIGIFAPFLAPPAPGTTDPLLIPRDFEMPKPPGASGYILGMGDHTFILGSGEMGIDIYYGIVWGARTSIITSLFVVMIAAIVGIVLGAVAGYYGGRVDETLMRITDIFLSIPGLIMAMAVAAVLGRGLENIMLALIIVWWPGYTRLVRALVLSVRERTYVEAAVAVGAKKSRILWKHIVPNSLGPVLVSITMDIGAVVLTAAALSYIGFGPVAGTAEWGQMISDGQSRFLGTVVYNGVDYNPWWTVIFPATMILIFVMGFTLFGDALRDIMDPRERK
ncbi:MAG: ABC transporter permease [Methanomassiliicoccales archaeon]